eukprot:TRINITY_DN12076_c2_g1_i2.p1 TRINITY_DN12076_c2_g1~~TRINITY_DN12076_c2_g1_i2.p1  ORF type:complete len:277 (+),score=81.67 TRINITY_DN12076_c2_g1_i2:72-833(+)
MASLSDFQVHPTQLIFPPPLTDPIECPLTLTSTADQPLIYKLRTGCPERYGVRPSVGCIAPRAAQRVRVNYRPRGKGSSGWQPEDPATIDDSFHVEIRHLEGAAERDAYAALRASPPDYAAARSALGMPDEEHDSEISIVRHMWNRQEKPPKVKVNVACIYGPRPEGYLADGPQQQQQRQQQRQSGQRAPSPAQSATPSDPLSSAAALAQAQTEALRVATRRRDALQAEADQLRAEISGRRFSVRGLLVFVVL